VKLVVVLSAFIMKYLWLGTGLSVIALTIVLGLSHVDQETNPAFPFDLANPSEVVKLPSDLREISGLAWWDDHKLAGIQDEDGFIFIINLKKQKVKDREKFTKDGDYEGIAKVGKKIYITRSDGQLYRVKSFDKKDQKTKDYNTPLKHSHDVEGLCYDQLSNNLLLACKDKSGIEKHKKHRRSIFAFDLDTKKLVKKPWMTIDTREIQRFAAEDAGYDRSFNFMPSGIEVHPTTGHIFIISSPAQLIVEIDREGAFISSSFLPREDFVQPEGITFDPDGNLYISNEGRGQAANIMKFVPRIQE
jgi:uncharacterized protein YjiK